MIDFESAIRIGEEMLSALDQVFHLLHPSGPSAEASGDGNLLQVRRRLLAVHAKRHLVTELTSTGKLTQAEAQAMVDAGAPAAETPEAPSAPFANILAWLQTNGPSIAADIAAAIPVIISLITLFGG
jgi:hypothetical protein